GRRRRRRGRQARAEERGRSQRCGDETDAGPEQPQHTLDAAHDGARNDWRICCAVASESRYVSVTLTPALGTSAATSLTAAPSLATCTSSPPAVNAETSAAAAPVSAPPRSLPAV